MRLFHSVEITPSRLFNLDGYRVSVASDEDNLALFVGLSRVDKFIADLRYLEVLANQTSAELAEKYRYRLGDEIALQSGLLSVVDDRRFISLGSPDRRVFLPPLYIKFLIDQFEELVNV